MVSSISKNWCIVCRFFFYGAALYAWLLDGNATTQSGHDASVSFLIYLDTTLY
ncbi:hypothetical protein [Paenibacillus zanthoxyli]|uniref:hypothetical protein n=1 Tax=Paenibacillus zanthoxyli TaxID=369399 RepID=UPI0004B9FB62|nr:hypothetical protein [Paenibacillus zanthoxyli]